MTAQFSRSWSVKSYLIALAICCAVPIALVAGFFAVHAVEDAAERTRSDFKARLYLLRDAVDERINTTIRVLESLATSPALRTGDFEAFRQSALETARSLGVLTIVLSDATGRQLVNTRAQLGTAIPARAHVETQERVLATGEPQVSDLYEATIDQRPVISVEVPVRIDGQIRYVLSMGIEPQYLSALLSDYVPDGFIGSIIDRNGILIARQAEPSAADLIGAPTIPEVRSRLNEREAFWIEAVSRSGVPTFTSILHSQKTGWSVNLAIPRSQVEAPLRKAALFTFGIAALGLLIGLSLARLVAGRLSRSAILLEEAANQIGSEQHVIAVPTRVREYDSALKAFAVASNEISRRAQERAHAVAALRESESRWRSMAEALPNLVWTDLPNGQCDWLSSQWGKYTGIPEQELLQLNWIDRVIHPDDRQRTLECWRAACEDRGEYDLEYRIRRYDGQYRWFKTRGVPLRDESGKIVYWFGTCTDIEDIRSAEKREQVLMQEVNHRANNMLALVQAIARQTAFKNPQDFISRFEARLYALAASQDLLVKSGWKDVPLQALIRTQLAHFADLLDDRILLSGPDLKIKAAAAQSLGMILHELSTNAAKYGALSVAAGGVSVEWSIQTGNDGVPEFNLQWTERNGPAVQPPAKRGFGSTVLEGFARMSLKGNTLVEYASTGLVWNLNCALAEVIEDSGASVDASASRSSGRASEPTPGRSRILIVEDEALPAMEMAAVLSEAGFEVLGPAGSVREAFRYLEMDSACDAALLDINLGSETSEPIARKLADSGTPFIAISGYSREQLPAIFAEVPFHPKPLDHAELINQLRLLLDEPERGGTKFGGGIPFGEPAASMHLAAQSTQTTA
jgi:PAS domain S-box-containing protein